MRTFLALLLFSFAVCHAKVVQYSNMADVMSYFENGDSNTLVIFDIDLVLIQPAEPAFQMPNMQKYHQIASKLMLAIPPEKREISFTLMTTDYDSILVDEMMPTHINAIQSRNISTMALTAHYTGPFENIPNLEIWKSNRLMQLGINFTNHSPIQTDLEFIDVSRYRNNLPIFTKGILFTNGPGISKGEMLVKFLKASALNPKQIIYLDDREENVIWTEEWLQNEFPKIEYLGVWYTGALEYPSKVISEEEFVTKWQQIIHKSGY